MSKNRKTVEDNVISKILVIYILFGIILVFIPIVYLFLVVPFETGKSDDLGYSLLVFWCFLMLFLPLVNAIRCCFVVLFSDKDFTMGEFKAMLTFTKKKNIYSKNGNGVEGIVEGREYDLLDADDDGRILVSEVYPLTESEVLDKIFEVDPNFSKTEFKAFVKSVFMLLQKSVSENNYHLLRAFESDSLYYQHKVRIENEIKNGNVERREVVRIKGSLLKDFKIDGGSEIIIVALTATMRINSTGLSVLDEERDFPYIMMFARNKGVKTVDNVHLSTTNCCNCGAVIDVDGDGVCNYCNTSLVSGELEWVLIDVKNISLVKG